MESTQSFLQANRRRIFLLQIIVALCTLLSILLINDNSHLVMGSLGLNGMCPLYPPSLKGPLEFQPAKSWQELEEELEWVSPGGCWHPPADECVPRQKILVVIGFRDRDANTPQLLQHLHPMLRAQLAHYCIVVVSQNWDDRPYNRGMLFNIGFDYFVANGHYNKNNTRKQSLTDKDSKHIQDHSHPASQNEVNAQRMEQEQHDEADHGQSKAINHSADIHSAIDQSRFHEIGHFQPDCIIFHDVDLVPLNDFNLYNCSLGMPKHLGVAFSTFNYTLPYRSFLGGVLSLTPEDFVYLNGFANLFWGWGGEDDDFWNRVLEVNLTAYREPDEIGRYQMLSHRRSKRNGYRSKRVIEGKHFYKTDGLNSLKYEVFSLERRRLFTNLTVSPIVVKPSNMVTSKPASWTWSILKRVMNF